MRITVLTLFPEVFEYFKHSIIKRAQDKGLIEIEFVNPRDFTADKHRTVDDVPYGGGAGMVLKPEPIFAAIKHVREKLKNHGNLILTSPVGKVYHQNLAQNLARQDELVFLCGHYEGFDERIRSLADMEISIGDYVLTGGELPVMVIVDALARHIPGVIDSESAQCESFGESLLDHPHYTRPAEFMEMKVPEILLSGNHEKIRLWRRKERIKRTLVLRPDLLKKKDLNNEDLKLLREINEENQEN